MGGKVNPKSDPAVSVDPAAQEQNSAETAGRNPKEIQNARSETRPALDMSFGPLVSDFGSPIFRLHHAT
jgi:hypothetical protein